MKRIIKLLMIPALAVSGLNALTDQKVELTPTHRRVRSFAEVISAFRFNAFPRVTALINSEEGLAPFICVKKNDPRSFHSFVNSDPVALKERARAVFNLLNEELDSVLKAITPEEIKALGEGSTKILTSTEAEFEKVQRQSDLSDEAITTIVMEIVKLLDDSEKTVEIAFVKKLKRADYKAQRASSDEDLKDNNPLYFMIYHRIQIRADLLIKFLNLVSAKLLGITPEEIMTGLVSPGSLAEKGKLVDSLIQKVYGFSNAVQATPAILSSLVEGIEDKAGEPRRSKFATVSEEA